jgi:hypothetical protein
MWLHLAEPTADVFTLGAGGGVILRDEKQVRAMKSRRCGAVMLSQSSAMNLLFNIKISVTARRTL